MSTKKIIGIFTQLAEMNKFLNERFKVRAYQNAIASLKKLPANAMYKNCADLIDQYYVPGISLKGSLCCKIDEIIKTGRLNELKQLEKNADIKKYRELLSVKDIGYTFAKKLIEQHGIKSVKQLHQKVRQKKITLTRNQTLGLVYYSHLKRRVPYHEIAKTLVKIKKILKPFRLKIIGAGSYRRNSVSKGTSHDIDVLIFNNSKNKIKMEQIVKTLENASLLLDQFSMGPTKFQGILNNKPYARQIDIRLIPPESFATALLYFTGSKNFNQTMRHKAIGLGYKLSEYSLLNNKTGKVMPVHTEKDVFKLLKMKYLPPKDRD